MKTRLVTTAAVVLSVAGLTACGGSAGTGAIDSGTTSSASSPTPSTVTVTVTATPTASSTLPAPTLSRPGKPNPTMSTPPPAKDPLVIPDNPQAYGQAFVTAWVGRDRARAARLGTATAVTTAFASTTRTAPAFRTCDGAAGSSYCTWQGDEYTMTVRVLNERSSQRQDQAVIEVTFAH